MIIPTTLLPTLNRVLTDCDPCDLTQLTMLLVLNCRLTLMLWFASHVCNFARLAFSESSQPGIPLISRWN